MRASNPPPSQVRGDIVQLDAMAKDENIGRSVVPADIVIIECSEDFMVIPPLLVINIDHCVCVPVNSDSVTDVSHPQH